MSALLWTASGLGLASLALLYWRRSGESVRREVWQEARARMADGTVLPQDYAQARRLLDDTHRALLRMRARSRRRHR